MRKNDSVDDAPHAPDAPWSEAADEVAAALDVAPESGLSNEEVRGRRRRFGPNRLRQAKRKSGWLILAYQFKSVVILLLTAASLLSFAFGQWMDGTAIAAAILLNTLIGFFTELKATRSMEALQRMGRVSAKVRRSGHVRELPAQQIVPGDVVVLEGGDLVTADLRLIEAAKLQANESALTGESVPVTKRTERVDASAALAERDCMLFKGTAVTRGSGAGIVVATGMQTELGRIASLAEEAGDETTPLEQRLDRLGRRLVWLTLALVAVVTGSGALAGRDLFLMIETGIALAIAAIPEGLPIVATIALARGMWRMANRNALVSRLSAVETLGSTNIICTDKTGTLTENRMTVTRLLTPDAEITVAGEPLSATGTFELNGEEIDPAEHPVVQTALRVGVLCNNAELSDEAADENEEAGAAESGELSAVGDPLEVALLVAGARAGLRRPDLLDETPEEREEAFDSDTKMMATFHRTGDGFEVAVKGAPEAVLNASVRAAGRDGGSELGDERREQWLRKNEEMAADGLRVLALSRREVASVNEPPYAELTFLGLVGLLDPPREAVRDAIDACQAAGIRVVMLTGDQPPTARHVGLATGLVDDEQAEVVPCGELGDLSRLDDAGRSRVADAPMLARVSPKQKLDLIGLHQDAGSVVAMTGDGVNDAPALRKADIGVAMGQRGTQVAREAGDVVLRDDALGTIVMAVEQGRAIFANIRRFIVYLLSGNMSEILAVSAASLLGLPLPILPLQILFLNLVNDVFPALALGVGRGPSDVMQRPPRGKGEPVLQRRHWWSIVGYGALIAVVILTALVLARTWLGLPRAEAVSISFLTLAFGRLWHVFNMRPAGSGLLRNDVVRNPYVWGALAVCTGLLLSATYLPGLSDVLKVHAPAASGWGLALGLSLVPLVAGQALKVAQARRNGSGQDH
jgi:Ca2+-transporting ATPase